MLRYMSCRASSFGTGAAFYLFRHAERDAAADALKGKGISAPTSEEIKDKVRVSIVCTVLLL